MAAALTSFSYLNFIFLYIYYLTLDIFLWKLDRSFKHHFDSLVQDYSNSTANAL